MECFVGYGYLLKFLDNLWMIGAAADNCRFAERVVLEDGSPWSPYLNLIEIGILQFHNKYQKSYM
jgi:hypothetical protein